MTLGMVYWALHVTENYFAELYSNLHHPTRQAKSGNSSVTATKYIRYINSIHVSVTLSITCVNKVLLQCHSQKPFTAYQNFD